MSTSKYGGPAFPQPYLPSGGQNPNPGMTLRDWFAGMALQGMISNTETLVAMLKLSEGFDGHGNKTEAPVLIVNTAYEYADEMLKAREK